MKTVLITGSTDGIGKQTALELAEMGYEVIIHGKNPGRVKDTVDEVIKYTGNKRIDYVIADFSRLGEVKKIAEELLTIRSFIDVLINNAGVYSAKKVITEDGYELTLTVNHLSHFLLTNLAIELIKKSDEGRIINVSSMIHSGSIDFDNLNGNKYYSGGEAYSLSKLCNILFTYKLARMLEKTNVTVNCLHPGVVNTKLLRSGWGGGGVSVKDGARNSVYLASSEEVKGVSGKYFVNMRPVPSKPITYDISIQDRCWEESKRMVSMYL